MLKTTTKQAKQNIKNYIMETMDANWETCKEEILGCYNFENLTNYKKAYNYAADGNLAVYYDEAREAIKEWLEETEEEASSYDNEKVWKLYCHLIAREISK